MFTVLRAGTTPNHPLLAPGRRVGGGRVGDAYGAAYGGPILSASVLLGLGHDL